jgi:hypothetical protein
MGTLTPLVNSLYSIKQKPLLRGGGETGINGLGDEALHEALVAAGGYGGLEALGDLLGDHPPKIVSRFTIIFII